MICWDLKVENDTSIIVATEVAGMEAMRGYTKFLFMRDFRLRTTKREGWVILDHMNQVEAGLFDVQKEAEDFLLNYQSGYKVAHVTWKE